MKKAKTVVLLGLVLLVAACGTMDVKSVWTGTEIKIDGRADDWQGGLVEVKGTGVSLGVRNDDRFVFLCLKAEDQRTAAQVLRAGLIVWFDPQGGAEKTLGIHYPLAADLVALVARSRGTGEQDPAALRERRQALAERREEIEILGPGRDESIQLRREELKGIEVAFANAGGVFIYEIKVPLTTVPDSPYAVVPVSGNRIGIGFDSPRLEIPTYRRGGGGRIPGGGGIGGIGRTGSRGGGGRIGGGRVGSDPVKMQLIVTLAEPPEIGKN
ncbi:MAG: hypothetical protein JW843_12200 [Candidatus Aminicenantes bacterium]|nr:hypothetical protein [Candidatus Aminicenantes bacterium]